MATKKPTPQKQAVAPKNKKQVPAKKVVAAKKPAAKVTKTVKKAVAPIPKGKQPSATKKVAKKVAAIPAKKNIVKVTTKKSVPVKNTKKVVPAAKPTKPVVSKSIKALPPKNAKQPMPAKGTAAPAKSAKNMEPVVRTKKVELPKAPPRVKHEVVPLKLVKVPKTTIKTSVPYQPGYTPLSKRPVAQQEGPVVRYSDTELGEFREIITKKLEGAKKELAYFQGMISRRDELGNDESESRYITMEEGGISMEREQLGQMSSRLVSFIDHLEKAIMRIDNKTYGICRETGKLIDKARLRAVPHATLSLEAKLGLAKKQE